MNISMQTVHRLHRKLDRIERAFDADYKRKTDMKADVRDFAAMSAQYHRLIQWTVRLFDNERGGEL